MSIQTFAPSPPLREYVQLIWTMEGDIGGLDEIRTTVPAESSLQFIIHWADPFRQSSQETHTTIQPQTVVSGPHTGYSFVQCQRTTGMIAAIFYPWTAHCLVHEPLTEIANHTTSSDLIFGSTVNAMAERFSQNQSMANRVALFEGFLLKTIAGSSSDTDASYFVKAFIHQTRTYGGCIAEGAVARSLGISIRTLQRKISRYTGLTPLDHFRIARFNKALERLTTIPTPLSQLARECGYTDQSHMTREFAALSGMTPGLLQQSLQKEKLT